MLQPDAQQTDEKWCDDVKHHLCAFRQKIRNWMSDAEAERKQLSALDFQMCLQEEKYRQLDQSTNIHQDQAANNQQTQVTNLQEKTEDLKRNQDGRIDRQSFWRKGRLCNSKHKDCYRGFQVKGTCQTL